MKRFAVASVTVVAILALLVAALPFIVPGAFLRDLVASKITTWTGRTVLVAGEPRLSIYPELAITVDDLTVSNPGNMGDEAFVAAEGVRASMRALPLLIGRVEFNEFELIRPRFRFVVVKDGGSNWEMTDSAIARQAVRAAEQAAEAATEAEATGAPAPTNGVEVIPAGPPTPVPEDIRIGRVTVTDGIILYDDLAADHREEMADLDLDLTWPTAASAASGSGSLQWRGQQVKFNGSIANPLKLIAGGASPVRFAVAATTLRASFAGEARTDIGMPQLSGRATLATPSLRRTLTWFGTPLDAGATLGTGSIDGTVNWTGRTAAFDMAAVELDGNRADGSLAIVLGGPRPAVQGTLTTERLDLTPYAEAARAGATAEGPWPIAPTALPLAAGIDLDIHFTAGQILAGATRLGKFAGTVRTDAGAIDLDIVEAQFYGGRLSGRARAGMVGDELVTSVAAEISRVPARVALADIAGVDGLDGTAAVKLNLTGRGRTWGELARALAGTAAVAVTGGSLSGLDVAAIAETMADPLAEPLEPTDGTTAFSSLAATLAISGGILSTEDLVLRGTGLTVTLSGTGSVLTGLIDAKARLTTAGIDVPVAVTGRWRAPVIARDVAPAAVGVEGEAAALPTGG